jgi:acyl-CoA thioester hydrolase
MTHNPTPSSPARAGTMTLRVRYHECDPMGVAHHASYAPWLEMGRTELLRTSGLSYAHLEQQGVFLVIAKLEIRYKRPIRYDDVVEVRTRVVGGGELGASRVKIEHEYELWIAQPGGHTLGHILKTSSTPEASFEPLLAASARTTLACVQPTGELRALPDWLQG